MDTKAEHARREAEVWAELARVPEERWTDPGILPGWSVNDLVWHVAGWIGECAGHLERMREGTFVEPDDSAPVVDAKNAAFAEEARSMDARAVRAGLDAVREHVLRRWDELPTIDDSAIEWFAGETYDHYLEHLPHVRSFAGGA